MTAEAWNTSSKQPAYCSSTKFSMASESLSQNFLTWHERSQVYFKPFVEQFTFWRPLPLQTSWGLTHTLAYSSPVSPLPPTPVLFRPPDLPESMSPWCYPCASLTALLTIPAKSPLVNSYLAKNKTFLLLFWSVPTLSWLFHSREIFVFSSQLELIVLAGKGILTILLHTDVHNLQQ